VKTYDFRTKETGLHEASLIYRKASREGRRVEKTVNQKEKMKRGCLRDNEIGRKCLGKGRESRMSGSMRIGKLRKIGGRNEAKVSGESNKQKRP